MPPHTHTDSSRAQPAHAGWTHPWRLLPAGHPAPALRLSSHQKLHVKHRSSLSRRVRLHRSTPVAPWQPLADRGAPPHHTLMDTCPSAQPAPPFSVTAPYPRTPVARPPGRPLPADHPAPALRALFAPEISRETSLDALPASPSPAIHTSRGTDHLARHDHPRSPTGSDSHHTVPNSSSSAAREPSHSPAPAR